MSEEEGTMGEYREMYEGLARYMRGNEKQEVEIADMMQWIYQMKHEGMEGAVSFTETEYYDINKVDSRKKTFLHLACQAGDYGVVRALLETPGINLDIMDKEECTPLCVALREQQFEIAKLLVEAGADVNVGGGIYGSALLLAVVRSNL